MPESGEKIPLKIINQIDRKISGSGIVETAIAVAKLNGNVINESSKQSRLNALMGDELYGDSQDDAPDLSLYGKIFNNPDEKDREKRVEKFKQELLYPGVLIDKNNVPNSYFALKLKVARERNELAQLGYTNISNVPIEVRQETGRAIYNDQKASLDRWIDYLVSPEAEYPTWFKYYVLSGIKKMGIYDKASNSFSKRTRDTTTIFPDLNRKALEFTYDTLVKYQEEKGTSKKDKDNYINILNSVSFSRLYPFAMEKVAPKENIEGEWVKFSQYGDSEALYKSFEESGVTWCIVGEDAAKKTLQAGDFYVFYTKDEKGENNIPKIAIRMQDGQVAEVRGVEAGQNVEANLFDIAKEKYKLLPGGDKYEGKEHDMKLLTLIDEKTQKNLDLTIEELSFIYEIDRKIETFGYDRDPRVKEIISRRNLKKDVALVLNCDEEQISTTEEEALKGNMKYHYGDLDLSSLTSAEGTILPEIINGNLDLFNLISAKGITLPKSIIGGIDLSNLTSTDGLILPKTIGGNISLSGLTSADGLVLSEFIYGSIDLSGLTSVNGMVFPESTHGSIDLSGLTSAKGLIFPKSLAGDVNLHNLISFENLDLPKLIIGNIDLSSLTSAEGLILPKTVMGDVLLPSLNSAEKMVLPELVGGNIKFHSLASAKGLILPRSVVGDIYFFALTSIEGLFLPSSVEGDIFFPFLSQNDKKTLRERYPNLRII